MKNVANVGLGLGDEGKGTTTEYEAIKNDAEVIIRYGGGPQAAHNIVLSSGIAHTFAQFGSATFAGCRTFISQHMVVDPLRMWNEADILLYKGVNDPLSLMTIDARCAVVTPLHMQINRMREIARGANRHGSCGLGVGEAIRDREYYGSESLTVGDLASLQTLKNKLKYLWCLKLDIAEQLMAHSQDGLMRQMYEQIKDLDELSKIAGDLYAFASHSSVSIVDDIAGCAKKIQGSIIFEGSQGALLDVNYGFNPYVTKADITLRNANDLSKQIGRELKKVGVLRAYATRHGAGPFVTEDARLTSLLPDVHNGANPWQGNFRVGWFDLVATRYSLEVVEHLDEIALTNIDRLQQLADVWVCTSYILQADIEAMKFDEFFEGERKAGVWIIQRIKKTVSPKVEHQKRLTELLLQCCPIYLKFGNVSTLHAQEKYIKFIERELGISITIVSYGPTFADKRRR